MNEESLLNPLEIKELSNNFFKNLRTVIYHCTVDDLETRLAALEKLADDFSPSEFVAKYYPQEKVFNIYRKATKSNDCDEVVEAISAATNIDCSLAREICINNLEHPDVKIREEAICCLGYVGDDRDSKVLTSILENERNDILKSSAFNSLIRLGYKELLTFDRLDLSQLSVQGLISIIENLYTLVEQYDLQESFQFISNIVADLENEELNNELLDLKRRINKDVIFREIDRIFSHEKIDWQKVIVLMSNADKDIRFKALANIGSGTKPYKRALPNKPPQLVFDKVVSLVDEDEDDEVRAEGISVLGDWEYRESIELISRHLHDDSELVRLDAIYALGEIQGNEVVEQLQKLNIATCSDIEKVRLYQSLIRCGHLDLLDKWLRFLKSEDALVRANVAGGVWSVWNTTYHLAIEFELEIAKDKETHIYVLNEIDDALDWLKSKESFLS